MKKIWNKVTCIFVSLTLLMGCMATPAFAYSSEDSERTTVSSIFETEEEPVTVVEQDAGPLTPEGNLTVVDDYQTTFSDGTAQQFITLVSKSGAYFSSTGPPTASRRHTSSIWWTKPTCWP